MPNERAYEISVIDDPRFTRAVFAKTAGKARYQRLRELQDTFPDINFKHLRCRSLGFIPVPLTRQQQAQLEADEFNEKYPVGTQLAYWSFLKEGAPTGIAAIRHKATVVCESAAVWLEGVASCHSLSHVEISNAK